MISIALRGLTSLVSCAVTLVAIALLSSCGGGGAQINPTFGGPVGVAPSTGNFYAGIPSTITIFGDKPPYSVTSSDPATLPVPAIVNGSSFQVVPNNPGVVDSGLQPGEVPRRTVIVTVRGENATQASATIAVLQNFLMGYTVLFTPSTCPALATGPVQLCSGGQSAVRFAANFNGSLHGNEGYRLTRVSGSYRFIDPVTQVETTSGSIVVQSDHEGVITARINGLVITQSELAILRITHIATGVQTDTVFTIVGAGTAAAATLTAFPPTITFTGVNSSTCGTGTTDFLVFGAGSRAPVSAFSANGNVVVTPATSATTNPARFTVTVNNGGNPPTCITAAPIVVTDATGGTVTVTVTTTIGPAPTPPQGLAVAPTAFSLACGTSGSVTVVGGVPPYRFTSTHPRVIAVGSGNVITVTRVNGDAPTDSFPTTAGIGVTDSVNSSIQTVLVTVPANCP